MTTVDIRILSQYRENYGTEVSPRWKMKGGVEFVIKGVSDSVMYLSKDEMDMAITEMLSKRSNVMCSYELISWDLIFGEPVELDRDDFMNMISTGKYAVDSF